MVKPLATSHFFAVYYHLMRYTLLLALLLVGCKATLETGYQPRPLNASEDTRRAYYAPPFSPEAHVTDNSNQQSPIQPMGTSH